jgi:hypothetical protein
MAQAASEFLSALTPQQRAKATFDFESDERENWHFIPRPRQGLSRGDMSAPQLEAADHLVATGLSERGHDKANAIVRHETILGEAERRVGETRFQRSSDLYYASVFGDPDNTERPWGWRFEGHHVSLNFTMVDGETVSVTPSFFGANPAEVKQGPSNGLRILSDEEDLARSLLTSLRPDLRRKAIVYPTAPAEILTRASRRVNVDTPAGLAADLMSSDQRDTLMSLVRVFVERKTDEVASQQLGRIGADGIGNIHFAWAGSEHRGQGHYYRLHGPGLFVEYDNTQNGANHVHAVWRDTACDFGADVLAEHYREHHS